MRELANQPVVLATVLLALAVAAAAVGWWLNNRLGGSSLEAARKRAEEAMRVARRDARKERQAILLEARQKAGKHRKSVERDLRQRKSQLTKRDRELDKYRARLQEDEGRLAQSQQELEQSRETLEQRRAEVERLEAQADELLEEQNRRLERVSGMTREEAKRRLLQNLRAEARYEATAEVKRIKDEARDQADRQATKIISLACERLASEISSTRTTFQFPLPEGDKVKGRLIGQEGRNIRAFEQATGIQLLIDEENNVASLSGFNPVNREIARRMMEAMVKDRNLHPKRIEELFRRTQRKLEEEMRKQGQEAAKEMKIRNLHPELVKLLGRLRFRTSYGQNVLEHSKEVGWLTGMMAAELGLDEKLARRAGLLHDIGKAIDYEMEGTHPEIGAELGEKCGEDPVVINAIASHHEDCEVTSPISVLVMAADALSGARPGARRKSAAEYVQRIEKLEELANEMNGVEQSYALHAGREIRVIAQARKVDDARADLLASDLANKIQSEMDYPGRIKVTVIREVRASAYAKGHAAHG